jgi:hypothetical protein
VKPDPKLRADGRCVVCGGDRTPKTGMSGISGVLARAVKASADMDPFCSATCARAWHAIPDPTPLGAPPTQPVQKYFGATERRKYRIENRVPCEGGCGKLVEGKGRGTKPGSDRNRPYMCIGCGNRRRGQLRKQAKEAAA